MRPIRRRHSHHGASLIEFALTSGVFLVVLFGVLDWSWVFFQHQTLLWRASDAARWASANRLDQAAVRNIVLCGSAACDGGGGGFFDNATVTVEHVRTQDRIDSITNVVRYYARVTVSGYRIHQFTPIIGGDFTGRPIVVAQPMECQASSGNCQDWI